MKIAIKLAALPIWASQPIAEKCAQRNLCKLHYAWIVPIGGIVNLAGTLLQPLLSLVALATAGIFALIAKFSAPENKESWNQAATMNYTVGILTLFTTALLFCRIFYPGYDVRQGEFGSNDLADVSKTD